MIIEIPDDENTRISRSGKTVHLQELVKGEWKTVLTRTLDPAVPWPEFQRKLIQDWGYSKSKLEHYH